MAVNNGQAVDYVVGNYRGRSRLIELDGVKQIAIFADPKPVQSAGTIKLGDADYAVRSLVKSDLVKGMVVLTVEPASAPETPAS